jgi:hypothetical protein
MAECPLTLSPSSPDDECLEPTNNSLSRRVFCSYSPPRRPDALISSYKTSRRRQRSPPGQFTPTPDSVQLNKCSSRGHICLWPLKNMQWEVSDEIVVDHVIRPLARMPPYCRIPLDLTESANWDAPPVDTLASSDLVIFWPV